MNRITPIEGLRAWLALWVMSDHVLGMSGYFIDQLSGPLRILRSGWYAVDVFVIISGFVIFHLLVSKKQNYTEFILQRFFRLWPLFIVLFAIAIPVSLITLSNLGEFAQRYPAAHIGDGLMAVRIQSWWDLLPVHVLLHLPMLHGMVPEQLVPSAPSAFLDPAWSISLEWQFYLLAPLVFTFIVKRPYINTLLISLVCLIIFGVAQTLPEVQFGAFLPMHIQYFYLGGLSCLIYQWVQAGKVSARLVYTLLLAGTLLAVYSVWHADFLPLSIWLVFFSLLCALQLPGYYHFIQSMVTVFDNRLMLYLGKISYSLYLSHFLVIILCQYLILRYQPELTQQQHLATLAVVTLVVTMLGSHWLYRHVETPGIRLGKRLTEKISPDSINN